MMCTTCGCGLPGDVAAGHDPHYRHGHGDPTAHAHSHGHAHNGADGHRHEHVQASADGRGHDHAPAPGVDQADGAARQRLISVERDILGRNDRLAAHNRDEFARRGIFALNLVSSPGSGKTTLLCRTLEALKERRSLAVIEGDQHTSNDAERIRATGIAAYQVNTGRGCHLDADMVRHAMDHLDLGGGSGLFIENVGNLVCPAEFDLGESARVVVLSVTEGDDKPLKYAPLFASADVLLLNKIDLLPYVDFDRERCLAHARRVRPGLRVFELSARTGEGMEAWVGWLEARLAEAAKPHAVSGLEAGGAD